MQRGVLSALTFAAKHPTDTSVAGVTHRKHKVCAKMLNALATPRYGSVQVVKRAIAWYGMIDGSALRNVPHAVMLLTSWIQCPWLTFRLACPSLPCLQNRHPLRVTYPLWFLLQTASRSNPARRMPCRTCSTVRVAFILRVCAETRTSNDLLGALHVHASSFAYFSWAMSSFCGSVGMLARCI